MRLTPHHQHAHTHHGGGYVSNVRPDIEGLSEKYWGEILERTVSSGSLHALQKGYPHHTVHHVHHVGTPHHSVAGASSGATTMTTSFSKHSDLDLTIMGHRVEHVAANEELGLHNEQRDVYAAEVAANLSKFSNSEPKLCEHLQFQHDVNCAKSKTTLGGGLDGRSIPDI